MQVALRNYTYDIFFGQYFFSMLTEQYIIRYRDFLFLCKLKKKYLCQSPISTPDIEYGTMLKINACGEKWGIRLIVFSKCVKICKKVQLCKLVRRNVSLYKGLSINMHFWHF